MPFSGQPTHPYILIYTVKNYLHGLRGFVVSSQKFVVYNRPRGKSKRSKFPWSKLQRVCTKLYSYIVLYYAKFGVMFGKSYQETKLGPKYKCNIENYTVFVLLPKTFVTDAYFLCLPLRLLYHFVLHKIISWLFSLWQQADLFKKIWNFKIYFDMKFVIDIASVLGILCNI